MQRKYQWKEDSNKITAEKKLEQHEEGKNIQFLDKNQEFKLIYLYTLLVFWSI